ncbi:hypothetical protein PAPHI01_1489 [Pancytospora philotis]|nr:hypothetical protein PAPHI01_1489 [Pancytospora philotis]
MNGMPTKEQELLTVLDNIEKSYNPLVPGYKFSHVFYNIVDRPFERPASFPPQLWARSLLPDPTLMPVILNRAQIDERRKQQNELATKLNESHASILKKIEALKSQRASLNSKMELVASKLRRVAKQYAEGDSNVDISKIDCSFPSRGKYLIKHSRDEVLCCLAQMRERLLALEKSIGESLGAYEKRTIADYQLNY